MQAPSEPRPVPIKLYRTHDRVTVAAAMPGLEPEDITVEVLPDNRLVLRGRQRGRHAAGTELVVDEWHPGPYERVVALPDRVNGEQANVTYSNGVLVVALPVTEHTRAALLTMESVGRAHGERVGNVGHPPHPSTTEAHRAAQSALQAEHGGRAGDHREHRV
jgi:HSP20 family protein